MPTDTNENSSLSTVMTTVTDNNNGSSSVAITTQSPPLSSSSSPSQTTIIRSNSPIQTLSKQLDKLRRFLSTLYYFGLDISNDIGERVRALILALIVCFSNENIIK
jgi:hypothetical protein